MSPHFESQPADQVVVPRQRWFIQPAVTDAASWPVDAPVAERSREG